MGNAIYYAIGDIHGEADRLLRLHAQIERHHEQYYNNLPRTIIHLGDYVDRGLESYEVIEFIMSLENDSAKKVINLKGNHEHLMIEGYIEEDNIAHRMWMNNGGLQTMESYRAHGLNGPPQEHLEWLLGLQSLYWDKEAGLICVHAGIDPNNFPFENEDIRLWTRSKDFFDPEQWSNPELDNIRIVHGHTPTETGKPDVSPCGRRINIDTGACYGGALTAAVFVQGKVVTFLHI